jgi:hypothetical protein
VPCHGPRPADRPPRIATAVRLHEGTQARSCIRRGQPCDRLARGAARYRVGRRGGASAREAAQDAVATACRAAFGEWLAAGGPGLTCRSVPLRATGMQQRLRRAAGLRPDTRIG